MIKLQQARIGLSNQTHPVFNKIIQNRAKGMAMDWLVRIL